MSNELVGYLSSDTLLTSSPTYAICTQHHILKLKMYWSFLLIRHEASIACLPVARFQERAILGNRYSTSKVTIAAKRLPKRGLHWLQIYSFALRSRTNLVNVHLKDCFLGLQSHLLNLPARQGEPHLGNDQLLLD